MLFFYPPSLPSVQAKLEEALALATDFQNSLQDFINWLTLAEQSLNIVPPPSLILNAVLAQIDEHKVRAPWAPSGCWDAGSEHGTWTPATRSGCYWPAQIPLQMGGWLCCLQVFANEVNANRDRIIELDQTGNQLKFLSQKQDVVLIKNLLVSVQSRWEKVVQRSVERGRALDDARKRAKQVRNGQSVTELGCSQPWDPETRMGLGTASELSFKLDFVCLQFHEAWKKLIDWLEDAENHLDSELEISNDPDKIKLQLSKHKVELC